MCLRSYGSVNSQATATLHTTHRLGAWFEYSASTKTFVLTGILAIWVFRKKTQVFRFGSAYKWTGFYWWDLSAWYHWKGQESKLLLSHWWWVLILNDSKSRQKTKEAARRARTFHSAKMCALSVLPNFAINLEISSCLGDKVGAWFAANQIRKNIPRSSQRLIQEAHGDRDCRRFPGKKNTGGRQCMWSRLVFLLKTNWSGSDLGIDT